MRILSPATALLLATSPRSPPPALLERDALGVCRELSAELPAAEIVPNLLAALDANDEPTPDAGLATFWAWTHELYRGRPVNGHGNFDEWKRRASQSEVAGLIGAANWEVAPLALVGDGTKLATQVALVRQRGGGAADGEAAAAGRYARRYLFQLKREERPPYHGAWSVWGLIVSSAEGDIQDLSGGF
jgi:hypothetical protein